MNKNLVFPGREHRIRKCDALHLTALKSCRSRVAAEKASAAVPPRRRWWGGSAPAQRKETKKTEKCDPHEHRLIRCRALALGCSSQVKALQSCRAEGGGECVDAQKTVGKCLMERRMEMRDWWMEEYGKKEKST